MKFTKVNGTERTMRATLSEDYLSEYSPTESNKIHNPDVCNVWSVDDEGWRSFRWDHLVEWEEEVV